MLDCSCNRLKEAEAALRLACVKVEDFHGTCPADAFGWEIEDCADCKDDTVECWRKTFIRKARRMA